MAAPRRFGFGVTNLESMFSMARAISKARAVGRVGGSMEVPAYIERKLRWCRRALLVSVVLLYAGEWVLVVPAARAWFPPGSPYLLSDHPLSLGDWAGDWLWSHGFGSGPLAERPYDYLFFAHLAISLGLYAWVGWRANRIAICLRAHIEYLPRDPATRTDFFMGKYFRFLSPGYPVYCMILLCLPPWSEANSAQKIFYLLVGVGILALVGALMRGTILRGHGSGSVAVIVVAAALAVVVMLYGAVLPSFPFVLVGLIPILVAYRWVVDRIEGRAA